MQFVRKRLTYANVMSSIAVFLVLGGATAFAAGQLGKNSVGSKQLKKEAVTAAKIKNEAVTGAKIKKGSITGANVDLTSLGQVPSAAIAGSATNADHATSADHATNATNATNADHATNATNAINATNATNAINAANATTAASPGVLASGKTETGVYYGIETPGNPASGYVSAPVSFPFPLASPPATHYLAIGASPTPECPGTAETPKAAPGNFCAYETVNGSGNAAFVDNALAPKLQKYGIGIAVSVSNKTINADLIGTWAVTAP